MRMERVRRKIRACDVERVFRETMQSVSPKYFHVAWSIRFRGAANQLAGKLGPDTLDAVRVCVRRWGDFREIVMTSNYGLPLEQPNIMTILKYPSEAMTFLRETRAADLKLSAKLVTRPDFATVLATVKTGSK